MNNFLKNDSVGNKELVSDRVLVALSGGVDSSVCVHLLKQKGYEVRAVVMRMSELHEPTVQAAKAAAEAMDIPLTVLDRRAEFEDTVIRYFLREYQNGRTPNPCVLCNPTVKFKSLVEEADRQGCAYVATGHYARIEQVNGQAFLKKAVSLERDQSYMLYRLNQSILTRLLTPLAEMEKPRVREIAADAKLPCFNAPDSQENCFIAGKDYASYIVSRLGAPRQGDFIAPDGSICGRHQGIIHYTVGQRRGLGVALGRPVFVKTIDPVSNRIYLADAGDDETCETEITELVTVSGIPFNKQFKADVKIRSVSKPVQAEVIPLQDCRAKILFDTPQRAVAGGQSLVIYEGDRVLGGGFISPCCCPPAQ